MPYQTVFKRYELKYTLTKAQKQQLLAEISPHITRDRYGRTTVRNLYYDTDDYRLIRHSLEKPVYKEKLRLRSYERVADTDPVFVELKKKYEGVVYKRRLSLPMEEALSWLGGGDLPRDAQIAREIDYFLHFYPGLHPTVYLSYQREAYHSGDFRITFDENLLARTTDLSLDREPYGTPLLEEDLVLLELKCNGGIPLWMTQFLTREHIYKTPFSKYGMAYQQLIKENSYVQRTV